MNWLISEQKQLKKKPYKPDLHELLSQCELNYKLIVQVCPSLNKAGLNAGLNQQEIKKNQLTVESDLVRLEFEIIDIAKYTTTMILMIKSPILIKTAKINKITNGIELIVRIYHDAKMLEVMEGSGPSTLKAIYHPASNNIKPMDEKRQINRFVGECLRAVLFA